MQNRYSKEFKQEAVRRSYESGKPATQVAKELGMSVKRLYKWRNEVDVKQHDAFSGKKDSLLKNELKKLRRENAILKEERDILKKSLTFFARDQDRDLNSLGPIPESFR